MPEMDRLAKRIAHRQEQEKKNERIRMHKNKIENDNLQVQVSHLDWSKVLRSRELAIAEEEYIRKLEKIYERQMYIQQKRIELKEKKKKEREAKKKSLEVWSNTNPEIIEKEKRRQVHGMKQEWTKMFINKAKALSGGYRDNDPPIAYYRRKGIVPPERMVTPEVSAEAQANYGGGCKTPSSAEHLHKAKKYQIQNETLYGGAEDILISRNQRSHSRTVSVRSQSARSGESENLMPISSSSSEDEDDLEEILNEVIRVNVRPSTAPTKRVSTKKDKVIEKQPLSCREKYDERSNVMNEPEIQTIEVQNPTNSSKLSTRPATAVASVRFSGTQNDGEVKPKKTTRSAQRRGSMIPPRLMIFHNRDSSLGVERNRPRAGSAPARSQNRQSSRISMSNDEQDRIKRKIHDNAECLYLERTKRTAMTIMKVQDKAVPRRIQSANSKRELTFFQNYIRNTDSDSRYVALDILKNSKRSVEMEAMLDYLDRCERGDALLDKEQAKATLVQTTRIKNETLRKNVHQFIETKWKFL